MYSAPKGLCFYLCMRRNKALLERWHFPLSFLYKYTLDPFSSHERRTIKRSWPKKSYCGQATNCYEAVEKEKKEENLRWRKWRGWMTNDIFQRIMDV